MTGLDLWDSQTCFDFRYQSGLGVIRLVEPVRPTVQSMTLRYRSRDGPCYYRFRVADSGGPSYGCGEPRAGLVTL